MSDRPRRALADDEEPEEIPEVRFVEEGAIPARRAAGSENVSDQPTPHAARAMAQVPASGEDSCDELTEPDKKAGRYWKGPVWAVTLAIVAIAMSLATSVIPPMQRSAAKVQPISSGRTLVCPPSQGKASLAAGSSGGSLQVGTSVEKLSEASVPVMTNVDTSAGYIRSTAGQRRPSGSALSSLPLRTLWWSTRTSGQPPSTSLCWGRREKLLPPGCEGFVFLRDRPRCCRCRCGITAPPR